MEKTAHGKLIVYKDKIFNFIEIFNPVTGLLIRGDINNKKNNTPTQRSFPELIDIGIMGSCHISNLNICNKAGIDCYQNAINSNKKNIALEDYKLIINQCKNKVFQVALGGAGDPNKHENFKEILQLTRKEGIVPNLTTSGMFLTDDEIFNIKKYCGAVAVSFYSRLKQIECGNFIETNPETISAINRFVNYECITNIHYVISIDTIKEAIFRLKNKSFPEGINAVIFILYKPTGLGTHEKTIDLNNEYLLEFFELIQKNNYPFKIGFDTCFTPAILKECKSVSSESLDFCEAARFSMYIDSELNAYPCSFDCDKQEYRENLKNKTILSVWNSETFHNFKNKQESSCLACEKKKLCLGGCVLDFSVNVCGEKKDAVNRI